MVKRNTAQIESIERFARMVGDNADDVHLHFADTPAVQEVGQAMVKLRYEQQDIAACIRSADRPLHLLSFRQQRKMLRKDSQLLFVEREQHPHEEDAGFLVLELRGLPYIGTGFEQKSGHAAHDPRLIRTRQS